MVDVHNNKKCIKKNEHKWGAVQSTTNKKSDKSITNFVWGAYIYLQ